MILYNLKVAELFHLESRGLLRQRGAGEFEAASYVSTTHAEIHADFSAYYTHATSPLRRYADLVAQRHLQEILKGAASPNPSGLLLLHLNKRNKQSKCFERDCFFLKQISIAPSGSVECSVRNIEHVADTWKVMTWVPTWNRFVSLYCQGSELDSGIQVTRKDQTETFIVSIGMTCQLQYYCDMKQPNWKKRMILSLHT